MWAEIGLRGGLKRLSSATGSVGSKRWGLAGWGRGGDWGDVGPG